MAATFWDQIHGPALLLDEARARRNLERMAARAGAVRFRPHFKTHQSQAIGRWFRAAGVTAITASSLAMADYFAADGWDDIVVAFPVNAREMARINDLAGRINLGLLVADVAALPALAAGLRAPVQIWLEIDAGYGRSGFSWDDDAGLLAAARAVTAADKMTLAGVLTHAGDTYGARGADIAKRFDRAAARLGTARDRLAAGGFPGLLVSVGDTPGCSVAESFAGVDEIRPGNFIFFDVMQVEIGACSADDVAVAVACPVVARQPERGRLVVYGGAVHFSKEAVRDAAGNVYFGQVVRQTADGWAAPIAGARLVGLSQEHGIIAAPPALIEQTQIGDLLLVLPAHSCLTANLLGEYLTLGGARLPLFRYQP